MSDPADSLVVPAAPPPHPELRRLDPLVGHWTAADPSIDEHGSRYIGVVDGDSLTFTGPARVRYGLDADGRIAVGPDDTIAARWWLPDGSGGWTPWRDVTYRRAVEPT